MTPVRVLVTGTTGFIGSHLTRLLVREGCTVYALIRSTSDMWRIKDILQSLNVIRGDLVTSLNGWEQQVEKIRPETCFHLAWYAEPGRYLASQENLNMLTASIHLASHLARSGCKKFIGVGTCFEYDTDLSYLQDRRLAESSPTKPRSLYAASKLASYLVLEQLTAASEMDFAWVRLFHQYGPYEDQRRLVPSVIRSLLHNEEARLTKGEQIRDVLHVADVATAIWAVAQSNLEGPVNIGSGRPVTVRHIAMKIADILNRQELIRLGALPYGDSDPMFICANNSRLKENTTWAPRDDLEAGLRRTIEWCRAHLSPNLPQSSRLQAR